MPRRRRFGSTARSVRTWHLSAKAPASPMVRTLRCRRRTDGKRGAMRLTARYLGGIRTDQAGQDRQLQRRPQPKSARFLASGLHCRASYVQHRRIGQSDRQEQSRFESYAALHAWHARLCATFRASSVLQESAKEVLPYGVSLARVVQAPADHAASPAAAAGRANSTTFLAPSASDRTNRSHFSSAARRSSHRS
jgi:hypothetical protein